MKKVYVALLYCNLLSLQTYTAEQIQPIEQPDQSNQSTSNSVHSRSQSCQATINLMANPIILGQHVKGWNYSITSLDGSRRKTDKRRRSLPDIPRHPSNTSDMRQSLPNIHSDLRTSDILSNVRRIISSALSKDPDNE